MMCELGIPPAGSGVGWTPSGTSSSAAPSPGMTAVSAALRAVLPDRAVPGPPASRVEEPGLAAGSSCGVGSDRAGGEPAGRSGYWQPMRNRPTHSSAPCGSGATRIRSPLTTTPRPDRSTTHSPAGVSTSPQWYAAMSSALRWILHSGDRPTRVISRLTDHRSLARLPLRKSRLTTGRVLPNAASDCSGL